MSSVLGPSSSCTSISAAQLRCMLEQALPSDAQLDAFCIDYVPTVHRQFSDGMERTRKLNLLLTGTLPEDLLQHLNCYAATLRERVQSLPARSPGSTTGPRHQTMRLIGLGDIALGVLGVIIGIAVLVLWLSSSHSPSDPQRDPRIGHDLSAPVPYESLAALSSPWLTSEPSSVLIYEVPSGILLGQTPWAQESALNGERIPRRGLQVCLRSPGYIPLLVMLEPGAGQSRPRTIHVRLQREPRAAQQRDLGQEKCNVPTPILK